MENTPPSLGDQIARLHGALQAQEKCVWIPTPIHTLIMACLARIFGRLEQLIQLWQAGILPPPPTPAPRDTVRRDTRDAPRTARHRTSRANPRSPLMPDIETPNPSRKIVGRISEAPSDSSCPHQIGRSFRRVASPPPNRAARDPPSDRNRRKPSHSAAHPRD